MTENSSQKESIVPREIEEEMKQSYVDYAMSVIVGRALPDVRDGLKPVHRRILFAMNELGNTHSKPFKKCARIVGEVLGKYHPHGDMAVYDALVRMVQPFSLRYPLVQGQGNFGSVDGDNAAAMRYTEARLTKLAEEILEDIEKETVSFVPNFDNTLKEPTVLPSKIPNLLLNGSSGIAVGMATNIPPHNMGELCDTIAKVIDNPDMQIREIIGILPGPDFPTGASICGTSGIRSAYETGMGKLILRAKTMTEEHKGKQRIIVSEIPYQVNKSTMIEEIADLVKEKKITGISDIKDESDRDGMRIVIEMTKGTAPDVVLNQLYKHTRMQETFGINMLALVNNEPKVLNIKQMITQFIHHRQVIVRKRTEFDLRKADEKAHILEGLIIALNDIDAIIQKVKKSKDAEVAKNMLITDYKLTEIQAKAILDMKIQKLAALEQENIRKEHRETKELIGRLQEILASEKKVFDIIKNELVELKKFSDSRRTEIIEMENEQLDIEAEDLIKKEDMVVTVSHSGYIKRLPISTYKQQRRGGKGVIGAETKEEDWIEDLYVASTHNYILFFTDKGQVHWLKVYQIPVAGRQATGKAIVNLLNIAKDEKISAMMPVREFTGFLLLCTKNGVIKKTALEEYSNPRKGGIKGIDLDEGDVLIDAKITDGTKEIILATRQGLAAHYKESDVRSVGRVSRGVRGISLEEGDELVGMVIASGHETLLTVCENGYGKRTSVDEYRLIRRGGKGVINIKKSERNGCVVSVKAITDDHDLVLISQQGIVIRIPASGISTFGRNTQGVRLMKLDEKDKVVATAMIVREAENSNGNGKGEAIIEQK